MCGAGCQGPGGPGVGMGMTTNTTHNETWNHAIGSDARCARAALTGLLEAVLADPAVLGERTQDIADTALLYVGFLIDVRDPVPTTGPVRLARNLLKGMPSIAIDAVAENVKRDVEECLSPDCDLHSDLLSEQLERARLKRLGIFWLCLATQRFDCPAWVAMSDVRVMLEAITPEPGFES